MYSNLKNVQYLLSGLKAYGISKVVVSPGNSHNAIVRSLEEDHYFSTYNIVDERSAAFFACGLIQELKEPIAICCTSGTAASNYLTGVTEASRRGLPLVVLTGDKNPYYLAQYEDQMIDNMSIFREVVRYGCTIPIVENENDEWYCQRVINEALLELNHHGTGPVHINIPIEKGMLAIGNDFTTQELPPFKKINRFDLLCRDKKLNQVINSLKGKRIFIICGQDDHIPQEEVELIETITAKYNCVFGTDKLSNLHCKGTIEVTRVAKRLTYSISELLPDVVISIAGNPCMDFKFRFKDAPSHIEHWIVNEEGRIADPFKKLTSVFEGNTIQFLEAMASLGTEDIEQEYYTAWKTNYKKVEIPEFPFSNLYTVQKLMNNMPKGANLNIANSTSIRIAQYFDLDESIQVYCNRGVNGIDGCVSTFIGQAAADLKKLNFLIVGDLAFFYDMNSIWNRYVGKNVRIMLNNNEGAALFHFNQGTISYPTLNENIAAEHFAVAKRWVESRGFKYLCARSKEVFDENLDLFLSADGDAPIFFEVFTHKKEDANAQRDFYDAITIKDASMAVKDSAKKLIKSVFGDDLVRKLKNKR